MAPVIESPTGGSVISGGSLYVVQELLCNQSKRPFEVLPPAYYIVPL